jgi:hypothetical protein
MRSIIAHTNAGSHRYKGSKRIGHEDKGARVYWQIGSARYQKKESPSLEVDKGFARIPHLPKIMIAKIQREIKGARVPHKSTQGTLSKDVQAHREGKKPRRATPGTRSKSRRAMASSSKGPMSTEERLKQMDTTLANLQQMLQHQIGHFVIRTSGSATLLNLISYPFMLKKNINLLGLLNFLEERFIQSVHFFCLIVSCEE